MALDRLLHKVSTFVLSELIFFYHKTLGHPESDAEENKWLLSEQERAAIKDDSSYKW
jgi:hypothetical protein